MTDVNESHAYDANGNQTIRTVNGEIFNLSYDAENRLVEVKKGTDVIATFFYDGDGRQVKSTVSGVTTTFVGAHYQIVNGTVTKYYFAGASRIAMKTGSTLTYLLGDHLGSTSLTTDAAGVKVSEMRYKPWGETRYASGTTATSYRYTGQREEAGFGLYFYNARWYDPALGRFAQADSIVPGGVQGWDRYAYVNNSPVRYIDPSGHCAIDDDPDDCFDTNKKYSAADFLDFTGYSNWEKQILKKLYNEGGQYAIDGVLYILENDIHLNVGKLPLNLDKDRGAWFSESANTITLNADSYSDQTMPDAWGLSLIIHEAKHLEQGTELSHSKLGEMEGWQAQFDVLSHFQPLSSEQQDVLNAQTVDEFVSVLQTSKSKSWRDYLFNGVWGLYTYPDTPEWYWINGEWIGGDPWWARLNLLYLP